MNKRQESLFSVQHTERGLFSLSKNSRKGKPIRRRRTTSEVMSDDSINLPLDESLEYVYAYKQSEGLRERTLNDYRIYYELFKEWLDEFYPDVTFINEVTSGIVRDYINYLQNVHVNEKTGEVGLSANTINIRLRNMRAFFNTLHQEEIINDNPTRLIKPLKVDEDTFIPLTDSEIERLLNAPDIREYAQFRDMVGMYLMLDTGIRNSEMFDLEFEDVDFKSRAIILPGSKTKNRKPRIMPLSNQVLRLLMELITEVKANFDTSYVFVSNFGEKYLPTSYIRRVRIYKERAGIEKRVTPHGLRHQFCRDYIMNGGDIFTLQRIAGHSNIITTRKYIQFLPGDLNAKHSLYSPIVRLRQKYRKK